MITPTYGVEIELDYVPEEIPDGWVAVEDTSLFVRGATIPNHYYFSPNSNRDLTREVKSPIIEGSNAFEQALIESISFADRETNRSCGMHTHVGFRFGDQTVRIAHLADAFYDELLKEILACNQSLYDWVIERDPERAINPHITHSNNMEGITWRPPVGEPNYGYGGRSQSVFLRPGYNSIEFRSPTPRLDRQELAEQVTSIGEWLADRVNLIRTSIGDDSFAEFCVPTVPFVHSFNNNHNR